MSVKVPPIKCQGIKTKLVPWIKTLLPDRFRSGQFDGRWIEPFMGSGVVGYNIHCKRVLMGDTNPHLIRFYQSVQKGRITPEIVREHLEREGSILLDKGADHYRAVRKRFNERHEPLDFLFLNRAGFNGMIRFNRKGEINVPFCKKPQRFAPAYITRIVNQIGYVRERLIADEFEFERQPFLRTIEQAKESDIVYCDPPYIDRHADYHNRWGEEDERSLFEALCRMPGHFILSTWHHNGYRRNRHIEKFRERFHIRTREHFYHLGGLENHRHSITEAIVANYEMPA